jgi:Ca2+-binding EF-hand superfamily protein
MLCGLLAAGLAQADERFDRLDFDNDGKVSKAEAAGNADLIIGFDRADRNKDGKLSRAEFDALLARAARAAAAKSAAAGSTSQNPRKRN